MTEPGQQPAAKDQGAALSGAEQPGANVVRSETVGRGGMRVATFVAVLAVHVLLFVLLPALRGPTIAPQEPEPSLTVAFLPSREPLQPNQPREAVAVPPPRGNRSARAPAARNARMPPGEEPTPQPITTPVSPDWQAEAEIAATDEVEREERKRSNPSVLAPHDFSAVPHGAVDVTKPQFGWSHAATHRLDLMPEGGFVLNINDRCAIAVYIIPMPICRIGKIPARGDLFQNMNGAAAPADPKVP
jgi:hypothetical protein